MKLRNIKWIKAGLYLVCLAIAIAFVGCFRNNSNPQSAASSPNTFSEILVRKQIRAAIVIYPPTVDLEKGSGKPSGFLIDIMDEIAKRAGLTVTYEPTTWDDLKAA